jgi:hypothetical protein
MEKLLESHFDMAVDALKGALRTAQQLHGEAGKLAPGDCEAIAAQIKQVEQLRASFSWRGKP